MYCIFGNPISHSKSPAMHNHFFEHYQINAKYIPLQLENASMIPQVIEQYNIVGANITVPFKEEVYKLCTQTYGLASNAHSVNTILVEDGNIIGYNTDADGFWQSLSEEATHQTQLKNILILGAGGTARSIACKLKELAIRTTIVNRGEEKLEWFKDRGFECFSHAKFTPAKYDAVVNTTSAGLDNNQYPIDGAILEALFANTAIAYDVIYNKLTPFLHLASNNNIKTINGKNMLIYQGVFASMKFMQKQYTFKQTAGLLKEGFERG